MKYECDNRDFSFKKYFLIILILITIMLSTNSVFANDFDYQNQTTVDEISELNTKLSDSILPNSNNIEKNMLFISDNGGTNILDSAANDILNNNTNLNIQIRSCSQISTMEESELYNLIKNNDIVVINWLTTDADSVFTNLLSKYPELSNKEIFLFLEVSSLSQAASLDLVKYSTINYQKIFNDEDKYNADFLKEYFSTTKRGKTYSDVSQYLTNGNGNKVNAKFNKMVLYKNCNDKENQYNQMLFALYCTGYPCSFGEPIFNEAYQYGIYRDKYMSLKEYIDSYFNPTYNFTIGLLESNMYVSSAALEPYYAIIEALENKGCNVIPVVAAGGSENQLKVMVEYFTDAPDYKSFLKNSSKYNSYVDAIVSMPAYGIGGTLFDNTTQFFEQMGVPVFRAVHSDYVSNEMWELSATGLPGNRSDKWWHVAIGEAQGIIEATFVGGVTHTISPKTGAQRTGYDAHVKNIDLFADRIVSWVDLQYKNNSNKKISLIYFNYPPGKQNIGSSYLGAITSIYNLLYTLKDERYDVGELPSSPKELENMMLKSGINVATWAPGELEKLANKSNVVLLPVSEYLEWFNKLEPISRLQVIEGPVAYIGELSRNAVAINYIDPMDDILKDWYQGIVSLLPDNYTKIAIPILDNIIKALSTYLKTGSESDYDNFLKFKNEFKDLGIPGLNGWGEAPGNIMTVTRNGIEYFVIPGLQFGNIFVAPEPQRGWEADSDALYHNSAVAPTHQYLAAYYYMQNKYPSAMVFVGRHATHEWLPGKEVLLSTNDYGSILVGDVPQIYFYISDGLGEGLQAKRRGFAVMISHLTSPLAYTTLYGNLTSIANLINNYENTFDENIKKNLANEIRELVISSNYVKSMGMTQAEFDRLNDDNLIKSVDEFLSSIHNTLYPLGLHALGQSWTNKDIGYAVSTALGQDFTYNGITTNLFDEISLIKYSKKYNQLNALEKDLILNLSSNVVISLLYYNSNEVATILGSNSSSLLAALDYANYYIELINSSINNEIASFIKALNGGYIAPGPAGDVLDVNSLPTGGNFFHDQSQELPTEDAYNYGKTLTLLSLSTINPDVEKVVMGIWCVETARDDGALVSVVLYLLGMKPVYTSSPSAGGKDDDGNSIGTKVQSVPNYIKLEDLVRPDGWDKKRIDVAIITSGNFRDLYSTQISLMDNAFRVALSRSYLTILNNKTITESKWGKSIVNGLDFIEDGIAYYGAGSESLEDNYVAKHWLTDFIFYKDLGYSDDYAAECAITRVFAPPNGDFGAGISKAVSLSWTWNNTDELANFYLNRMGNMYSKNYWGETNPIVFIRALNNTGDFIVSRNTNTYGVADNDDFFDYWGGASLAIGLINGKEPNMNVLMYGDKNTPYINTIETILAKETISRYFNPEWIKGMMSEGYSGARYISNKFLNNLLGWAVTRPSAVDNSMWDSAYDIYFKDSYGLGVTEWLTTGNNNYAYISGAGSLLTAAYEGYWKTDTQTLSDLSNAWANAVVQNGVACCDCSCGNLAMMQWAVQYINADLLAQLNKQLYEATQNPMFLPDMAESDNPNQNYPNEEFLDSDKSDTENSNAIGNSTLFSNSATNGAASYGNAANVGVEASEISASSSNNPSSAGENSGNAYEISKSSSKPKTSKTAMSIPALICVVLLVIIFAGGYFKGKREKE